MKNKILGDQGESIAINHLINKGYKILESNWRVGRLEVDIIAMDDDILVFIEVKTRNTSYFGFPENAVNNKKKRFLTNAANAFINQGNLDNENRFDIVSIIIENEQFELEHIEDAFYLMK
jgi:putative endonuclease